METLNNTGNDLNGLKIVAADQFKINIGGSQF